MNFSFSCMLCWVPFHGKSRFLFGLAYILVLEKWVCFEFSNKSACLKQNVKIFASFIWYKLSSKSYQNGELAWKIQIWCIEQRWLAGCIVGSHTYDDNLSWIIALKPPQLPLIYTSSYDLWITTCQLSHSNLLNYHFYGKKIPSVRPAR
jgi:hypothetical protein